MSYGLFYLPSSLPAARGEGAMRFRTMIDQAAYGGILLDELRDRFKENLAIVLKAWREPKLDHQGHFYNFHGVEVLPRPVQEPHPTVWMAATTSVESFEYSGAQGFHMMLIPFLNEVEELRGEMQAYFAARRAGGI